jgi:hypothetical protein
MEVVTFDGQRGEFLVRDFDSRRVVSIIELRLDAQTFRGRRVTDQIDDDLAADQRPTTPILGDVAKHPMFDLIPLAGAWREMADLDHHPQVVGESL